jgi:ParB family chromosome partitioning protein
MSIKKRGLGRSLSDLGLNELLSRIKDEPAPLDQGNWQTDDAVLKQIAVDQIKPGKYQPRRELDDHALEELADSIRSQGIIQPIVVRPVEKGGYEIIAGERRWRAAKMAGLTTIPALIRSIPDEAAIAMALIENIQRENLNAIEEAIALQRLSQEFDLTHQQIATLVGKSRATISNLLRLLNLPPEVKTMLESRELEMGHARALLSLDEPRQQLVAKQIILKNYSVRETELYIRRLLNLSDIPIRTEKNLEVVQIEKSLSKRLGVRVTIKSKDDQKGKLIFHYKNEEQLQAVLAQLQSD